MFRDRVAVVTGGTRGIGRAISEKFLKEGARLIIIGRSSQPDSALDGAEYLSVDLAEPEEVAKLCNQLSSKSVDILINNAGINKISDSTQLDLKDWDKIQQVNLRAPVQLCQAVLPNMITKGYGRIVNITSIFGQISKPHRLSYSTSKFGLFGVTKSLAVEFANKNILVNAVGPGFIETDLTKEVLSENERADLAAATPIGRLGKPEEIGELVAFLASDKNTFLTGQNIIADGGFTSV